MSYWRSKLFKIGSTIKVDNGDENTFFQGFRVFAGCLMADAGGQGAKDLREKGSERLHVVQLDITSNDQIAKAVEYVRNTLKEDGKGEGRAGSTFY